MKKFMDDDIFLTSITAQKIYEEVKNLPIFDYHCHLSAQEIYQDVQFGNLTELWLAHDHYKWRLMRAAGVPEKYICGDASDEEKFFRFAEIMPLFIGNPVYHWAHAELKKYFGIVLPICEENAKKIWETTKSEMRQTRYSARTLIEKSRVTDIFTTDDVADDLMWHEKLAKLQLPFKVTPSFRTDKLLDINNLCDYLTVLGRAAGKSVKTLDDLLEVLCIRADCFAERGCCVSDVSFKDFPHASFDRENAEHAFNAILSGIWDKFDEENYKAWLLNTAARIFSERGWVMQLHAGVLRDNNFAMYELYGKDIGCDAMGNVVNIEDAAKFFDKAESQNQLPRTIVYSLNPDGYYPLSTLLGCFGKDYRGKVQLGAAWWFADNRDVIIRQLETFAATGGLGYFNGMLTDSRSYVSYARHDYFRRILSDLLGKWAEAGEVPLNESLTETAKNICYFNAQRFFKAGE